MRCVLADDCENKVANGGALLLWKLDIGRERLSKYSSSSRHSSREKGDRVSDLRRKPSENSGGVVSRVEKKRDLRYSHPS